MKLLIKPLICTLTCLLCLTAYADSSVVTLSVPFQNYTLKPNQTISANYSFGNYPIIFCYENNQKTVGILYWPYKGRINQSTLATTLVQSANYQGSFADASGTIRITNNQNYNFITNCIYAF